MIYPINGCKYIKHNVEPNGIIPHTHNSTSEIILTFNNQGNALIGDKLTQFPENGLFFIHGHSTHFLSPYSMDSYPHIIMVLNTAEVERMCKSLYMTDIYNKLFIENGGTICSLSNKDALKAQALLLDSSELLAQNTLAKYSRQASILTELFLLGLKNSTSQAEKSDIIKIILQYINEHLMSKNTLIDIAHNANIDKYYLCKIFKRNLGVSVGNYITTQRISVAKQMLAETDMKIAKISDACHFSDNSTFTKTFTREVGMTPSDYRKKYK